jgi:hypothetical protein
LSFRSIAVFLLQTPNEFSRKQLLLALDCKHLLERHERDQHLPAYAQDWDFAAMHSVIGCLLSDTQSPRSFDN